MSQHHQQQGTAGIQAGPIRRKRVPLIDIKAHDAAALARREAERPLREATAKLEAMRAEEHPALPFVDAASLSLPLVEALAEGLANYDAHEALEAKKRAAAAEAWLAGNDTAPAAEDAPTATVEATEQPAADAPAPAAKKAAKAKPTATE